jgi:hypothetical protein
VDPTTDPVTKGASQIQTRCDKVHVSASHLNKEMRKSLDQDEQNSVHDLSVQCKKEWPVLHLIEIEADSAVCKRESSYEGTFVCKESAFYEVGRLAVL